MRRRSDSTRTGVLALALLALGTCGSPRRATEPGALPDVPRLRARVAAFYRAEKARDWTAHQAFLLPRARKEAGLETWAGMARGRGFEIVDFSIRSIEPDDRSLSFSEDDHPRGPMAVVSMDVTVRRDGRVEKETDQTDYWAYRDGEWYWTWRGWPSD